MNSGRVATSLAALYMYINRAKAKDWSLEVQLDGALKEVWSIIRELPPATRKKIEDDMSALNQKVDVSGAASYEEQQSVDITQLEHEDLVSVVVLLYSTIQGMMGVSNLPGSAVLSVQELLSLVINGVRRVEALTPIAQSLADALSRPPPPPNKPKKPRHLYVVR